MNNQEPLPFESGEQAPADLSSQGPADMQPPLPSPEPSLSPDATYRQLDPALDRPVGADLNHALPTTPAETYRVRAPYRSSDSRQQHSIRQSLLQKGLAGLIILMFLVGSILSVTIYTIVTHLGNVSDSLAHTFPLLPVGERTRLLVRDDNGSIHIQGRHVGIVTVQAVGFAAGVGLYRKPIAITYSQHEGILEVDATLRSDFFFVGTKGIDLTVTVPVASDVEVHLQSGSVQAEDIQGKVMLETTNGSLIANNVLGPLAMQLGTGPITVAGLVGQLNATVQSGKLSVSQTTLQGQSQLETQDGSISFNGNLDRHGSYAIAARGGYVDITLPIASSFRLDASSDGGKIANGFGHANVGKGLQPPLTVTTHGDAITLRKGPSLLIFA